MARAKRSLAPGVRYHVYNRALARRTAFETRQDFRAFLALLAAAVRRGELAVEAYALLPTHFHLLVRAPEDEQLLSAAMCRIEGAYSRYFNRTRKRDGPLWRSRFGSRRVDGNTYRYALHLYIDDNPVAAGICAVASEYPYGSAWHYARRKGPPWLDRDWVEDQVRHHGRMADYEPRMHARIFASRATAARASLVEARMRAPRVGEDDLENLVRAAPAEVRDWMRRKALLGDGTQPGLPVATPEAVRQAVRAQDWSGARPPGSRRRGPPGPSVPEIATMGLLRDACGLTLTQTARTLDRPIATVFRGRREYVRRVVNEEGFAARTAAALAASIRECAPVPGIRNNSAWHRT